jgi:hypothetical protein
MRGEGERRSGAVLEASPRVNKDLVSHGILKEATKTSAHSWYLC